MAFPLSDGYHIFPPGKLAAIVTWLEMKTPPQTARPLPAGFELVRQPAPDVEQYCELFRSIGEPWLWFGHLELSREELERLLNHEQMEIYYLSHEGKPVGLLDLHRAPEGEVEIVYFGLLQEHTGRGLGPAFMSAALAAAWRPEIRRVWLHTCTLDHPSALSFYRKCGFQPYQRGLELYDDPRLSGIVRPDAVPEIPLL